MLRKILDFQLSLTEKGKPLHKLRPLITAGDTFMYEPAINTKTGPHIRDAVDLKRWMIVVVFALLPCIIMAIWNTGLQKLLYTSGDYRLMDEYFAASTSFQTYIDFCMKDNRFLSILQLGALAFFPVVLVSYAVGGLWEGLFACVRDHEIAEGFLVTGILYPLVLPPTIPYWMVAVGVSAGVVIGKELFGGTGMNILNPALTCRAFLFFTFPGKMSGDVWVGTNPTIVKNSLLTMNETSGAGELDGYSQATPLALFNIGDDIKRVHVDAIASNNLGTQVNNYEVIQTQFSKWNAMGEQQASLGQLSPEQMKNFVTTSIEQGGLGLAPENYQAAYEFSGLHYGIGHLTDANFFFGNQLGSMGETSTFACLIGAMMLIYFGVGSWRTMLGMLIGALGTALLFQFGADYIGNDGGAWNPARLAFPAYKQLIMGGFAFGLVFMSTDPVSAPGMNSAKWLYGGLIGLVAIVIRYINPAYPEGVMLAILFGNCFAPLIDYYAVRTYRRKRRVAV
ncbi:MAG: Na(+)-transporting NADH-quinone reductase subunit B [Waddliaceae bacterium]|nr:Na(+)-transporting NADH-quinone reductase subunit B [Waddliaceae bacterium]